MTTQKMAKVFTVSTKFNRKGLCATFVATMDARVSIDYVMKMVGMPVSVVAKYEVTAPMPLDRALAYATTQKKKLGLL